MDHHGLGSRYPNVSPACVASMVDSSDDGTRLKGLHSFPAKGGGHVVPERGKPCNDTMDVLDLAIEYGDLIVDLSNLVSPNLPAPVSKSSSVKKQRSYCRLYPSKSQVRDLPDVSAEDILTMWRNRIARTEKRPSYSSLSENSRDQSGGGWGGYHSATSSWYDEQPQNTSATDANHQLEISPGVFVPLRGSDETWNAIERGFSSNADCLACSTALICIADADYILCPDCRFVSPTGASEMKLPPTRGFNQQHRGGVGLGLKKDQNLFQQHRPGTVERKRREEEERREREERTRIEERRQREEREKREITNANLQLEISPGVFVPLRGSDETWNAIERGFSSNASCFVCSAALICIADADYVLCPDCRVVSPTEVEDRKMPASSVFYQQHRGGVGLGLKQRQTVATAAA
jgi:hypothetical protein